MVSTEILQQLHTDLAILVKWKSEEINEQVRSMLNNLINLAYDCIANEIGVLGVSVAVHKFAEIYNRSENNS